MGREPARCEHCSVQALGVQKYINRTLYHGLPLKNLRGESPSICFEGECICPSHHKQSSEHFCPASRAQQAIPTLVSVSNNSVPLHSSSFNHSASASIILSGHYSEQPELQQYANLPA